MSEAGSRSSWKTSASCAARGSGIRKTGARGCGPEKRLSGIALLRIMRMLSCKMRMFASDPDYPVPPNQKKVGWGTRRYGDVSTTIAIPVFVLLHCSVENTLRQSLQIPVWPESTLRSDLEHRTKGRCSVAISRTVQIARLVENQASIGIGTWVVLELMEDALGPASISVRRELENRAISEAAARRRAVEIAGSVEDQAVRGVCPSCFPNEWMTLSVQLPSPFGVSSKTVPYPKPPPQLVVP